MLFCNFSNIFIFPKTSQQRYFTYINGFILKLPVLYHGHLAAAGSNTDVDTLLFSWIIAFREIYLQMKIICLKLIKCIYVFNVFLELHYLIIFCRADSGIKPDLKIKKVFLANCVRQICPSWKWILAYDKISRVQILVWRFFHSNWKLQISKKWIV